MAARKRNMQRYLMRIIVRSSPFGSYALLLPSLVRCNPSLTVGAPIRAPSVSERVRAGTDLVAMELERDAQAELQCARLPLSGRPSKQSAGKVGGGSRQVDAVEQIEDL